MTIMMICDRCGRLKTRGEYYTIRFKNGDVWDCCPDCKYVVADYCNAALQDVRRVEKKVVK